LKKKKKKKKEEEEEITENVGEPIIPKAHRKWAIDLYRRYIVITANNRRSTQWPWNECRLVDKKIKKLKKKRNISNYPNKGWPQRKTGADMILENRLCKKIKL
jgi:hypothetical protein